MSIESLIYSLAAFAILFMTYACFEDLKHGGHE
jgi:hypothetical protein